MNLCLSCERKGCGTAHHPLKIDEDEWKKIYPFSLTSIPYIENGYYYRTTMKNPVNIRTILPDYIISRPECDVVVEQLDIKPGEKISALSCRTWRKITHIAAR